MNTIDTLAYRNLQNVQIRAMRLAAATDSSGLWRQDTRVSGSKGVGPDGYEGRYGIPLVGRSGWAKSTASDSRAYSEPIRACDFWPIATELLSMLLDIFKAAFLGIVE